MGVVWLEQPDELILSDKSNWWWFNTQINSMTPGMKRKLHSQMLLQLKNKRPPISTYKAPHPQGVPNRLVLSPTYDDTTCYAKSTHNNWLSPTLSRSTKDFSKVENRHLKTLFWKRSQTKTLPDRRVNGPGPLFTSKKGCLFGKSHTSDFVRHICMKILLTN